MPFEPEGGTPPRLLQRERERKAVGERFRSGRGEPSCCTRLTVGRGCLRKRRFSISWKKECRPCCGRGFPPGGSRWGSLSRNDRIGRGKTCRCFGRIGFLERRTATIGKTDARRTRQRQAPANGQEGEVAGCLPMCWLPDLRELSLTLLTHWEVVGKKKTVDGVRERLPPMGGGPSAERDPGISPRGAIQVEIRVFGGKAWARWRSKRERSTPSWREQQKKRHTGKRRSCPL